MATVTRPPAASRPSPAKPPRDYLAEISRTAKPKPAAWVFYGPPGVGKTSFGAALPEPVFLHDAQEDGVNTLREHGRIPRDTATLPPAEAWSDVLGAIQALISGEHAYKTLVVDAIGGMERLCHEYVCNRDFNGVWGDRGFASYAKGYEVALADWRELLNLLDQVRAKRSMRVVLLGHSMVKPFKNPSGEDYDRYVPDVHHKTWSLTHRWADMVLFANYFVVVDKKTGTRAKGKGGQERLMYTEHHAAYEAKNRFGLPSEIEMGGSGEDAWTNLVEAIKGGKN